MMYYSTQLYHHGIEGQKWGVRRYQNEDGSYKPGAEGRYYDDVDGEKGPSKKEKKLMPSAKKRKYAKIALGTGALALGTATGIAADVSGGHKELTTYFGEKAYRDFQLGDAFGSFRNTALSQMHYNKAITSKKVAIGTGIAAGVLAAGFGAIKIKELMNKKNMLQAKENKANQTSEG